MKENTCCFFGHKTINETEELKNKLYDTIENLILNKNVDTFMFGSKSRFNDVCLEIVSKLKEKYPHVKRIYVRAEYAVISDDYKAYLLQSYEDTYYPEKLIGLGRAVYIKRNIEMINCSRFCIVYYNKYHAPTNRKSGTKTALDYAVKLKKETIIFC